MAFQIYSKEGPLAFWTGFGAYFGRTAPHAMIILLSTEPIVHAYRKFFSSGVGHQLEGRSVVYRIDSCIYMDIQYVEQIGEQESVV